LTQYDSPIYDFLILIEVGRVSPDIDGKNIKERSPCPGRSDRKEDS